jgi:glycerol-3-phosphate dehydrogenase
MGNLKTDIAIIGAGITGCTIARELSKYKLKILVIDKEADAGWGTTKGNSGLIHPGYEGDEGTLRLSLCHKGSILFKENAPELDIKIKYTGSLLNVFKEEQIKTLEYLLKQGKKYGVTGLKIITNKNGALKKIEPNISSNVIAALYCEEHCITSPYEAAIALYENARANSVDFLLSSEACGISYDKTQKVFFIDTASYNPDLNYIVKHKSLIEADFIINAAGVFADDIAKMIGDDSFNITAIKGQYFLLDSEASNLVRRPNIRIPDIENKKSKGMLISPTTGNNIHLGSNYEVTNKYDYETTKYELNEIKEKLSQMIEGIPFDKVITTFTGLRAYADSGDFIVGPSFINNKFINAAGIQSPGLSCSFIIAEIMIDALKSAGAKLVKNPKFIPERKSIQKLDKVDFIKNNKLYKSNSNFGEIVCRCEKVTEAEVVDAIKNGATTLDGIKFRTRAGMGRCQGGYCTLRVMKILSRELGLPFNKITKSGDNSYIALKEMI